MRWIVFRRLCGEGGLEGEQGVGDGDPAVSVQIGHGPSARAAA